MLQLLAGTEPHDLRLGRVQPQSAGCHPLVDDVDADSQAVNGYPYLADCHAHINVGVVGVLAGHMYRPRREINC